MVFPSFQKWSKCSFKVIDQDTLETKIFVGVNSIVEFILEETKKVNLNYSKNTIRTYVYNVIYKKQESVFNLKIIKI